MKNVGLTREIDKLGRLVIPKEMRLKYHLESEVEILPTDEGILIRNPKYRIIEIESVKETN